MKPARYSPPARPRGRARAVALVACAVLAPAFSEAALEQRSFLQLQAPPVNWVPSSGGTEHVSVVVSRADGLVFVGGLNLKVVHVVDARNAASPRLVCRLDALDIVDGLALDGNVLLVAGSDVDADEDGLQWTLLPADPFTQCPSAPTAIPGVESALTPNLFMAGGRRCILVSNRAGFPVRILDAATRAVIGSWAPADPTIQLADASVLRLASGQVVAAVAAVRGGAFVLDVTDPARPVALAQFDWTFEPPDFDGDPGTVDGCDRNGDGDTLECGEMGRDGDGRRLNFCTRAVLLESAGVPYVATIDGSLAGHVRLWSLEDILATCPGEGACPTDNGMGTADGPPWPDVDVVPLVAWYQVDACPMAAENLEVVGDMLFVANYEAGAHAIDLSAQGLPPAALAAPFELEPLASFDTLPGNSDTILENFPCHPTGVAEGCESVNMDWQPSPCGSPPPPGAAFRVVRNAGLRSATDVSWSGCRLHVSDQGTPDADGTTTHAGRPQGLFILGFSAEGLPEVAPDSLLVSRDAADPGALRLDWEPASLVEDYRVFRGVLPPDGLRGYDHPCLAASAVPSAILAGQVTTNPATPLPDYYYLVGCSCDTGTATLGANSLGDPRPPGAAGACP